MEAFEDLQGRDEAGQLSEFANWAPSPTNAPNEAPIIAIKANHAANIRWLLLAVIRARASASGHTLVIAPDSSAHSLGHVMLASCLPSQSQRQAHLTHAHYVGIVGVCNSFAKHPVALLVRDGKQRRASFIQMIGQHMCTTNAKLLIIDQPKRCFPRQPKGSRAWPDAIPPSIRTMASSQGFNVISLDSE